MLGNWSFGDYFKKAGAIELLMGIAHSKSMDCTADRLYVTYFEGKPDAGLASPATMKPRELLERQVRRGQDDHIH